MKNLVCSVGKGIVVSGLSVLALTAVANDQVIIKFKEGYQPSLQNISQNDLSLMESPELTKGLDSKLKTFKVPFGYSRSGLEDALEDLRNNPAVEYAQVDHVLQWRGDISENVNVPSDPGLDKLWGLGERSMVNPVGTNAQKAWDEFGVGGEDALGNEIVVVVVDSGFDINHEDLAENIFVNKGEIPNNGIDDDGNGYIDDVSGWNISEDTNVITPSSHGTHVAGTIGAVGDNNLGAVGVNWKIKILPLQLKTRGMRTSDVLKAYNYVIKMKQLYIRTNGRLGANIVVTNSSFGYDGVDCNSASFAAWNRVYDRLGANGILSAVATSNNPWNVDLMGDVPSACSSDYVISVTNTAAFGFIMGAWGTENVDLAAPGTNIFSTVSYDQYDEKIGTSMATPHVAGAVAYLHSAASRRFAYKYKNNPGDAALDLKEILLNGTHQIERFSTIEREIKTNGTLDIYASAKMINEI